MDRNGYRKKEEHMDLNVTLLHDKMVDKTGRLVTTSVTSIDVHDISRSCRTYGIRQFFVSHPSQTVRALVRTLREHWEGEFGSSYNPNRQDALSVMSIVGELDEAMITLEQRTGKLPKLVATSAHKGPGRVTYAQMRRQMTEDAEQPYLLMFGTGWGMSDQLMARADYILEPICGPTEYNHLSVRAAVAIILDRLRGA